MTNTVKQSSNDTKSICFVSPFIAPLLDYDDTRGTGGAERQLYLYGKKLAKRQWKVSYIIKNEGRSASYADWCHVYPININYLGGSNWNLIPGIVGLWYAMVRCRADFYIIKTTFLTFF